MDEIKSSNPVLVTGMHRSGTSMATRLLNLCGLHLGDPNRLLTARPDNPQGFWENLDFVTLDDRILARMGGAWDFPPTETPSLDENLEELLALARACVARATSGANAGPWGWKDPRCSLLLPFWSAVLPDMKVVVCLRDPLEVAASLSSRNGFSIQLGLHLWGRYNERLEQDISALKISSIVTHYEALLAHPEQELDRLIDWLGWDVNDQALKEACSTIKPELRHHRQEPNQLAAAGTSESLIDSYGRLCERAGPCYNSPQENDSPDLDALNHQGEACFTAGDFQAATKIFSDLVTRAPHHIRGRNNLACALWQAGRRDEAVTELAQVLKTEPDNEDATWNLGQFLRDMGRTEDAIQLFHSYLDRNPGRGDIGQALNDWKEAGALPLA